MSGWQRVSVFAIAFGGVVAVAVTKSAELGAVVALVNALLPSVLGKGAP